MVIAYLRIVALRVYLQGFTRRSIFLNARQNSSLDLPVGNRSDGFDGEVKCEWSSRLFTTNVRIFVIF